VAIHSAEMLAPHRSHVAVVTWSSRSSPNYACSE
jgi:hypothetical protein